MYLTRSVVLLSALLVSAINCNNTGSHTKTSSKESVIRPEIVSLNDATFQQELDQSDEWLIEL